MGVTMTDLDGQNFIDLTGGASYGVNVFGHEFYKSCIAEGSARMAALGPVLGSFHPAVAWNAQELRRISGLDEVSMHMSGTEAVMQAVRLARYHTRRKYLVRFCGAYHGWWDGVQPGPGNPPPPGKTYTLKEMHADIPARAAQAAGHRLCADESTPGPAPEQGRAGRRLAHRQRA